MSYLIPTVLFDLFLKQEYLLKSSKMQFTTKSITQSHSIC